MAYDFIQEYTAKEEKVKPPLKQMNSPVSSIFNLLVSDSGSIGLELEIEGNNLPNSGELAKLSGSTTNVQWTAHPDGSLRGENLEYVFSHPAELDEVEGMVMGLYQTFRQKGTTLSLSNRCSVHVHINNAHKKLNEVVSTIALWNCFEEALTNWAGPNRQKNLFCLTARDANTGVDDIARMLAGKMPFRFVEGLKYCALNITALQKFGSLEFRLLDAQEDPNVIIEWVKFLKALCDYASEKYQNPLQLSCDTSELGGERIFREICTKAQTPWLRDSVLNHPNNSDFNTMFLAGFREAQELVARFPWNEWAELCQKVYIPNPFSRNF